MLTNVIDKKANDPAHNVPFSVWKTGSGRPKPAADYLLKRESEKGVRSTCGAIPWANCAAISPSTEANLKP